MAGRSYLEVRLKRLRQEFNFDAMGAASADPPKKPKKPADDDDDVDTLGSKEFNEVPKTSRTEPEDGDSYKKKLTMRGVRSKLDKSKLGIARKVVGRAGPQITGSYDSVEGLLDGLEQAVAEAEKNGQTRAVKDLDKLRSEIHTALDALDGAADEAHRLHGLLR